MYVIRFVFLTWLVFCPCLHADEGTFSPTTSLSSEPLELNVTVGIQLMLTGAAISMAPYFVDLSHMRSTAFQPLNPSKLNALDRSVIGNHSAAAASISDALAITTMSLPFAATVFDHALEGNGRKSSARAMGIDTFILFETMSVNAIVCNVVKYTAKRPRPYMYDMHTASVLRDPAEEQLSFFSGHTAMAFSMASAYSYLFTLRHPDSPLVLPVWIGSHSLATATAVCRVLAGKHFWTDVMVGAAVGSAVGILVPALHKATLPNDSDSPHSRYLADVRIMPQFYDGGFGVGVMQFW